MQDIRHVGFHGDGANQWLARGPEVAENLQRHFSELQQANDLEPKWSNVDGSPSHWFKAEHKMAAVEQMKEQTETSIAELLGNTVQIFGSVVSLALVLD